MLHFKLYIKTYTPLDSKYTSCVLYKGRRSVFVKLCKSMSGDVYESGQYSAKNKGATTKGAQKKGHKNLIVGQRFQGLKL